MKNGPGAFFVRSLEAKYTYLRGFEHADFVNLIWPLEAPGPSWEDFGPPLELQGALWEAPGGYREKEFGPRRVPEGVQNVNHTILEPLSFYPKRSGAYKYSGFSVFRKKRFFFKFGFTDSQGGPGRVPRRALGAPEISKGALGKVARVQGGPFWGVLDRQKFARSRFLMEKLGGF